MAKLKRRIYNPAKSGPQVHDRMATELNRGIGNYVAPIEVADPYGEPGGRIVVMRSTRDDPLGELHARRSIDEAQYHSGRAFQKDFEAAERGPGAIDPSKEAVDGGQMPEPITEAQRRAAKQLAVVYRALGADGSAITHDVLVHNRTRSQIAAARGLTGKVWEDYYGKRFRECLNCLAVVYGFATKVTDP